VKKFKLTAKAAKKTNNNHETLLQNA